MISRESALADACFVLPHCKQYRIVICSCGKSLNRGYSGAAGMEQGYLFQGKGSRIMQTGLSNLVRVIGVQGLTLNSGRWTRYLDWSTLRTLNLCLFLFHERPLPHPVLYLLFLHDRLSGHRHLCYDSMPGFAVGL